MNGAGNDFILLDNRAGKWRLTPTQIARLCDRHRGVGADGLMLLVPAKTAAADWAWDFFNRDGSVAEMCGNGARCFARFVQRLTGGADALRFETIAGVISARIVGERVTVNLTAPHSLRLGHTLELRPGTVTVHSINTGVPHAVVFVPDADQALVQSLGAEIRHHAHFAPRGTNVNFAQLTGPNQVRVRTYERGVEGETLACGTGVTAAALIAAEVHRMTSPVPVQVQSGDFLEVGFSRTGNEFTEVHLTGPADFVFDGRIEI